MFAGPRVENIVFVRATGCGEVEMLHHWAICVKLPYKSDSETQWKLPVQSIDFGTMKLRAAPA